MLSAVGVLYERLIKDECLSKHQTCVVLLLSKSAVFGTEAEGQRMGSSDGSCGVEVSLVLGLGLTGEAKSIHWPDHGTCSI